MTKQETTTILALIKTAYPTFGGENPPESIAALWAELFASDNLTTVADAVRRYIQQGRFPPTIADIRAIITDMTVPAVSAGEIWDEVHRLLNWNISPDDSDRAYACMTDVCREAVLSVGGWYALSMSQENDPHIRRAFLQAAQRRLDRDRQQGIPFDRTKMNKLVHKEVLRLGSASGGSDG